MSKTTAKDFRLFKKECQRWIKFWGLLDWEIIIKHEEKDIRNLATIFWNDEDSWATIYLEPDWESIPITPEIIRSSAFHEIGELLLAPLVFLSIGAGVSTNRISREIHKIIRRMENVVFDNVREG